MQSQWRPSAYWSTIPNRSSIPASKVYAEADMVQISPASTNPAFTDDRAGPNIYRVCGRDGVRQMQRGAALRRVRRCEATA